MKRVLILLAGYPATGKSTFCRAFLKRHPGIPVIAPDEIKEEVWDELGFNNVQEKADLEKIVVWPRYYARIEALMKDASPIITDYPFSSKQKPILARLVEAYGYHSVTIRFVGDFNEIYRRSLMRDLSQERHLGHLMNHYHVGDYLADRSKADALVTKDLLQERCVGKKYGEFCMGDLIQVDVTGDNFVNPDEIIDKLDGMVELPG